ncbi:MAG: hypothetical protein MZV70_45285, partial [Desulfobacterales bacterium]|nr:hypothetical protein [Desulfobacterales bacterium]
MLEIEPRGRLSRAAGRRPDERHGWRARPRFHLAPGRQSKKRAEHAPPPCPGPHGRRNAIVSHTRAGEAVGDQRGPRPDHVELEAGGGEERRRARGSPSFRSSPRSRCWSLVSRLPG